MAEAGKCPGLGPDCPTEAELRSDIDREARTGETGSHLKHAEVCTNPHCHCRPSILGRSSLRPKRT